MASHQKPHFWKQMPFVRLIIPFIAGILLQVYFAQSSSILIYVAAIVSLVLLAYNFLPLSLKYRLRPIAGVGFNILFVAAGALLVYNSDSRNNDKWVGNHLTDSIAILATIQEPLVEKAKTYKAEARIEAIKSGEKWESVRGKVLIYFSKDTNAIKLAYGSQVLFTKSLQEIKNSGNPGAFNYKQYNAYQDICHQVFLKSSDYIIANTRNENAFIRWVFLIRSKVINTLQQYITGEKEAGVAEALLIGYRNDLDKDLVQAYSNTGVVHIIAISGLHLGMIYAVLVWLMKPFKRTRWIRWVKPLIILSVLWIFTLLAGGVPSILRSAVMFSFIVFGETINRKSSIYNTLASSAFVMLCISPYYLFDIGFQLSYAAVLSIITFAKPIHNWFYIKNKSLDFFWELTAVTLSAQILTVPIIFYSFHQFPLLFVITNILIVPLSTVILFAELLLLICSLFPVVATLVGVATGAMLHFMNYFIEGVNSLPFAVYEGIQNDMPETLLLYGVMIGFCFWLLNKNKALFFLGLTSLFVFIMFDGYESFFQRKQQKVVVYNIPQKPAIDFISGNSYAFVGDTALTKEGYLQNFHLKPSRTLHGIKLMDNLENLFVSYPFVQFAGKKILLVDKPFRFASANKIPLDLIVISRNPKLYISDLNSAFACKQYVFDASNSSWKIRQWKRDCDSLHLPNHSTADEGAFIMNIKANDEKR